MNSRSISDNLVNFSADLATTLNQFDSREPLLSFPFDHLYACSESVDGGQTLHLDKEVEISAHCMLPHQERHETQRLASLEKQNKKLKDLLIYHLDLIQQQNESMSKKEKAFQALRQENDTLKSKVTRTGVEPKVQIGQHGVVPSSLHVPVTAAIIPEPLPDYFNTFHDLLVPEVHPPSAYLYNPDPNNKNLDPFGLDRPSDTVTELGLFLSSELGVPSILEETPAPTEVSAPIATMIDNRRQKKESKPIEVNNEPKYTVTTTTGNSKILRNRKRTTGIGSFSRMPKTKATPKPEKSTIYDDIFNVNKQSNMTYGKSNLTKYGYTSLRDRLQLIDPTPKGQDPYQIGEAEMREQSPIPKLMLQKSGHGRMRIYTDPTAAGGVTSTITSTTPTRRIYDTMSTTSSPKAKRAKLDADSYSTSNMLVESKKDTATKSMEVEPQLDVEKMESEDWRIYTPNEPKRSLCDYSYGENTSNLNINVPLDITKMEFPDLFEPSPVNADSANDVEVETALDKNAMEKSKKRGASLAGPSEEEINVETNQASENKRGRKRALSTAASIKSDQQKVPAKPRARRAVRAKKTPVPGMMTKKLYHTCMGDPDLSWYLGLDPDIKKEDCEPTDNTSSNVEVPRWREKPYDSHFSRDGIENLDDRVFEKRHQKLEAEERRQLRWHMRRIREQRHVERLRQRQRDPWSNSTQTNSRGDFTVWPQPIRDLQFIEITETLPVTAFGEEVPDLPEKNFVLPWIMTSEALKRSKRSKTLH